MLRLFLRLFLLLTVGYGISVYIVEHGGNFLIHDAGERYNYELLRGQVYELMKTVQPVAPEEREGALERLRPHYGLVLTLVDSRTFEFSPEERAQLKTGRFVSRNDFEEFIVPLDPPDGTQHLRIEFPPKPAWVLSAAIVAYSVLAVLLGGVLLLWVRPHWRDLEALRAAANQFGQGNLTARAQVGKRSSVRELASQFDQMADRIQRLIAAQRELTNAVSHELRTPISRLEFELNLVAATEDDSTRARLLDGMRGDLRELEEMVSELLAYARLEHAQPHLIAVPVNAQDWMASVVGAVAHEAEAGGIECVIPANGPETVTLEPRFMARAVINLLRNAVRYAQRRVEVRLELTDSGYHCVTVDDDGPGVRAADRARIFEPFTRVDESRTRATGGFGLGLAIARRIVEWHGGTVEVGDSRLGGARFVLSWPVSAR